MPLGVPELAIVLVIVLLIFGPKRLPNLGRQLGGGMREFKDSITKRGEGDDEDDDEVDVEEVDARPAIEPPPASQQAPAAEERPAEARPGDVSGSSPA